MVWQIAPFGFRSGFSGYKSPAMSSKLIYCPVVLVIGLCLLPTRSFSQQYNYAPNAIHFCVLEKKHDSSLSGGFGRGGDVNSLELQAACSPVEHGAVMVNYFNARRKAVKTQQAEGTSSQFAEIGIGAYESAARGTGSLFIGYGQGSIFSNYHLNRTVCFDLKRWFIQPALVFQSHNFEWGLALRFTHLIYAHAEVDFSITESDLRSVQAIESDSPFFVPEFGVHAGIVFRPCTFSLNLTNLFYDVNTYNFARINNTFLLTVDLGTIYQKKKKPNVQ